MSTFSFHIPFSVLNGHLMTLKKRRALPGREVKIGLRLKEAREFLGFSQREFADTIGIKRARLASYEEGRVPLRWEVALRICQRFQISEHWLAACPGRGLPCEDAPFGNLLRAAMFVPSDPVLEKLRPGALFSEAFDNVLHLEYWKLLGQSAQTWVRFDFSEAKDSGELRTAMDAALTKWFLMIPAKERLRFCRRIMECGALLFNSLYAGPIPSEARPGAVKLSSPTKIEEALERELQHAGLAVGKK